jgi:hypothetical protein
MKIWCSVYTEEWILIGQQEIEDSYNESDLEFECFEVAKKLTKTMQVHKVHIVVHHCSNDIIDGFTLLGMKS